MAFWNPNSSEPLRQYRWYIDFGGQTDSLDQIRYALKKTDKPKAKVGEITHKYLNHFFYYPGRLEWESVSMTFAAVTQASATWLVNNVLKKAGYGVPVNNANDAQLATIGKNKFNTAIGNLDLVQINPEGTAIEKWTLYNPFFTAVNFGTLDYGSEEIVDIQCTVRYDYAKLVVPAANAAGSADPAPGISTSEVG